MSGQAEAVTVIAENPDELAPVVVFLASHERMSRTYRNRVPKPSSSNRNPNVKHEPEPHNS